MQAARRSSKPIIVDVSLDSSGAQVYQIHDSSQPGTGPEGRASKPGPAAGAGPDGRVSKPALATKTSRSVLSRLTADQLNSPEAKLAKNDASSSSRTTTSGQDVDIWSREVESAFEEALSMIPKTGLSKIKISGKSCGRNELISEFIMVKTGKLRTRKQVSSHIQVIKNLKKRADLIELINNGPVDPDAMDRFDKVFSDISFKKSTGGNSTDLLLPGAPVTAGNDPGPTTDHTTNEFNDHHTTNDDDHNNDNNNTYRDYADSTVSPVSPGSAPPGQDIDLNMSSFEVSLDSNTFTTLSTTSLESPLRLKPNASLSSHFPDLAEYLTVDSKINTKLPILHNLSNFYLSHSELGLQGSTSSVNTDLQIELTNVPSEDTDLGCLTIIYSFGNEVIRLFDDVTVLSSVPSTDNKTKNLKVLLNFAKDFWNVFLQSLTIGSSPKDENKLTIAVKAVTIKQVIFRKSNNTQSFSNKHIKCILLYEFTRSFNRANNLTSSRRLFMPKEEHIEQPNIDLLTDNFEPAHDNAYYDENPITSFFASQYHFQQSKQSSLSTDLQKEGFNSDELVPINYNLENDLRHHNIHGILQFDNRINFQW